ncbi:PREDICTED: disintegrin and metalloproteinase domain-containing protein 18-like, partial [Propithecus coquereli]|uniref:disintegrin and metalloproteinase domain-containing protein 18-like n=1 Tax=Propithecus coquereli TaxID=379532 RepID=UPI00063FC89C
MLVSRVEVAQLPEVGCFTPGRWGPVLSLHGAQRWSDLAGEGLPARLGDDQPSSALAAFAVGRAMFLLLVLLAELARLQVHPEFIYLPFYTVFQMPCHYQGYVVEFPNSSVTLSICSGLRGFLQLENISYGIEPLESSARFEHIIYQVKNDKLNVSMLAENYTRIWQKDKPSKVHLSPQKQFFSKLLPRYLEVHIIVEKALYDYMGSEMMAVTHKIIQIFGLVNTMFTQFKLTVILSSLELWSDKNKISTTGNANDILQRFLAWKRDYLILRPHDIAYLL